MRERWEEEHDKALREWWAEKYTATQITFLLAERFGKFATRNAVIGRMNRLGVPSRGRPKTFRVNKPKVTIPDAKRELEQKIALAKTHRVKADEPKQLAVVEMRPREEPALAPVQLVAKKDAFSPLPGTEPISFMEQRDSLCRWPVSGEHQPTTAFCGQPCKIELVYCPTHKALSRGNGTPAEPNATSLKGAA